MKCDARLWAVRWVLLVFASGVSSIPCPTPMVGLEKCECVWSESGDPHIDEVICRNLNHTTHHALLSLFMVPHVTRLQYTGNNIAELEANMFGDCSRVRFLNLTYVDLSNNGIQVIHGQSFHCVPNVRELRLNFNLWQVDPNRVRVFSSMPRLERLQLHRAFKTDGTLGGNTISLRSVFNGSHMASLVELRLGDNGIQYIDRRTFCQLPNLDRLYLDDNLLTKVSLDCLDRLRHLFVRNNTIRWLTEEDIRAVRHMENLSDLHLAGNPFQCTDCSNRTARFRDWLKDGDSVVAQKSQLTCVNGGLAGRRIVNLTDDDLKGTCMEPSDQRKSKSNTTSIITGIILSIIAVLTVLFLYVNRHAIQKSVSRWSQPIRNSNIMKRVHFGYVNMNKESRPV